MAETTDQKKVIANAVSRTADPTSNGYTANVQQSGQLGTYRLTLNSEHTQTIVYGSLDDMELLGQQILLDVRRQRDMAHLWWTPEVEA